MTRIVVPVLKGKEEVEPKRLTISFVVSTVDSKAYNQETPRSS
jgi:hypothetical protein